MTPDLRWLPFLKMVFGMLVLIILAALSMILALGRVEAKTSFGLDIILGGLLTLSGGFASWAFSDKPKDPPEAE